MGRTNNQIKRGEVWVADLRPGTGWEIAKKRPVLIISVNAINDNLRTIIVIPISSQKTVASIDAVFLPHNSSGLKKDSVVLTAAIRAIDKSRLVKKAGRITKSELNKVEESIKVVLGFTNEN